MGTVILKVDGMSCHHCVNTIKTTLASKEVIANVDLDNKTVEVNFDDEKQNLADIKETITELGYTVQ